VFTEFHTSTRIWSHELGDPNGSYRSIDLREVIDDTYRDLFHGFDVSQVIHVQLGEIQGANCITAAVQLWNKETQTFSDAILFPDPYSLQPIRTPILAPQETVWFQTFRSRGKSLLISTLRPQGKIEAALSVWDLSDFAKRGSPPLLQKWSQGHTNLRNLCIADHQTGTWDAPVRGGVPIRC
jgi:hypothetical protein